MSPNPASNRTCESHPPALVPKLRFPEFRGDGGWNKTTLSDLAMPVKKRAENVSNDDVLTLSAEKGIIRQTEYFGKQVAGKNLDRYLKIKKNDFVYNDRTTSASKYGTIKRMKNYTIGAVSPIYKCFRFRTNETPDFWECYFEGDAHEKALGEHINEGARAGRFNISVNTFLSISVCYPKPAEQQKIADCLGSLDNLIAAHSAKLEALQNHKKGLLQKLFPAEGQTTPELRFPGFEGEWEQKYLGKLCSITTGKLDANAMVKGGKYRFYTCAREFYHIDKYAFDTDALLVSGNGANVGYIHHYQGKFNAYQRTYVLDNFSENILFMKFFLDRNLRQRIELEKMDGNTPYIVRATLSEMEVQIPHRHEQQKIADCFCTLDDQITAQTKQIAALKEHKQGLMQQLFPDPNLVTT